MTKQTPLQEIIAMAHHDFYKALNTHAFFKVHDRAISDDLVQDTFLKTWNYLVKGGKIDMMKAFLYHVLNNLIIDQYRKHKTSSLDVIIDEGFEPSIDESEHLYNFIDGKSAVNLIRLLPESYQKVMSMKYVQDLSLKEMSNITRQSRNATAVKVHRGLSKLKTLYNAVA